MHVVARLGHYERKSSFSVVLGDRAEACDLASRARRVNLVWWLGRTSTSPESSKALPPS